MKSFSLLFHKNKKEMASACVNRTSAISLCRRMIFYFFMKVPAFLCKADNKYLSA